MGKIVNFIQNLILAVVVLGLVIFMSAMIYISVKPQEVETAKVQGESTINLERPSVAQFGVSGINYFFNSKDEYLEPKPRSYLNRSDEFVSPLKINSALKQSHVKIIADLAKADLFWHQIEPEDNSFEFTAADEVLNTSGIEPVVTLFQNKYSSGTPPWATNSAEFRKDLSNEAQDYLKNVVTRHASQVKYWQIGSRMDLWRVIDPEIRKNVSLEELPKLEPLSSFSIADQAKFMRAAAEIIRQYDSDAIIILPSLSSLDAYAIAWLNNVIELEGKNWFDVIAYEYSGKEADFIQDHKKISNLLGRFEITNKQVWLTKLKQKESGVEMVKISVQAFINGDDVVLWGNYHPDYPSVKRTLADDYNNLNDIGNLFKFFAPEITPFKTTYYEQVGKSNLYRFELKNGRLVYVAWGEGVLLLPSNVTQMTSVLPNEEGGYNWVTAFPGRTVELNNIPIVIK